MLSVSGFYVATHTTHRQPGIEYQIDDQTIICGVHTHTLCMAKKSEDNN